MAAADYRLCDICGSKTFYDSELDYDFKKYLDTGLYNLGAWICLCRDCIQRNRIIIVKDDYEE